VASAAGPAGVLGEPGLGGLLVSLGDALGGQLLAQPGMLVVHLPFLPAAQRPCSSAQRAPWSGPGTIPVAARVRRCPGEALLAIW
jgi:hypothetical protein